MSDNTQNPQGAPLSSSIHNEQSSTGGESLANTGAGTSSAANASATASPRVQEGEITDRTMLRQVESPGIEDDNRLGEDSGSTVVEGIDQWVNGDPSYGRQFLPDQQAPGTVGVGNVGELSEKDRG